MTLAPGPTDTCLQEQYAPTNGCFGCGPANSKGLRIRSFPDPAQAEGGPDATICEWSPQRHHEAFPGVLSGGVIGTILDCHSNWTSAWHLMRKAGEDHPPCTVTAEYEVKLLRPTPMSGSVILKAHVVSSTEDRVEVEASLEAKGKVCATCHGVFVAVSPGHPAYHRW